MADDQELELPYETPEAPAGQTAEGQTGASVPESNRQALPDLDLDPRFQSWKSKMDKQISSLAQETQAERARRLALEEQVNRITMAGMDDTERTAFERERLARENWELKQQLQMAAYNDRLRTDLEEISARTGVPLRTLQENISGDDDPHVRWMKALDLQNQRQQQRQAVPPPAPPAYPQQPPLWAQQPAPQYQTPQPYPQQPQYQAYPQQAPQPQPVPPAQKPGNRVDTGMGSPASDNRYRTAYKKAQEAGDVGAMLDIESAAAQAGYPVR